MGKTFGGTSTTMGAEDLLVYRYGYLAVQNRIGHHFQDAHTDRRPARW